MTVYFLS